MVSCSYLRCCKLVWYHDLTSGVVNWYSTMTLPQIFVLSSQQGWRAPSSPVATRRRTSSSAISQRWRWWTAWLCHSLRRLVRSLVALSFPLFVHAFTIQFSSVQDGICALGKTYVHSTPSLRSFPIVAFEIVSVFVWLTIALSHPFEEDHLALPLSMPLSALYVTLRCCHQSSSAFRWAAKRAILMFH